MRNRCAYTLVEVLVVIGIILVLVGIALPMLVAAYARADRDRTRADLLTIGVCLEAYKSDFGDYPRPTAVGLGGATLCKALASPGNATTPTAAAWSAGTAYNPGDLLTDGSSYYVCIVAPPQPYTKPLTDQAFYQPYSDVDGADGPGFRVRVGIGKPTPAYLPSDKFKIKGAFLLDKDGRPILYYPANPARPDSRQAPGPASGGYAFNSMVHILWPHAYYDAADNIGLMSTAGLQALLGDYSLDGKADASLVLSGPSASTVTVNELPQSLPYLLLTPGPDGTYGPTGLALPPVDTAALWSQNKTAAQACDDVTNWDR